jgi:hypothetical protein
MRRIFVGIVAALLGVGTFVLTGWRYVSLGVAFGAFALADRLGLVPAPYEPIRPTLFTGEQTGSSPRK